MSAINNESYLTGLVNELMSSLDHVGSHVEFQGQIAELDLDLETGKALCLIVTKLVKTRLKQPFPDDGAGEIFLALHQIDDSTLELSVAEDRIGLAQSVQWDKPNALGVDLVNLMRFSRRP